MYLYWERFCGGEGDFSTLVQPLAVASNLESSLQTDTPNWLIILAMIEILCFSTISHVASEPQTDG